MICKQGDLAYIKKALRPENIGKIVTCKVLIGELKRGEPFIHNGEQWLAYDTDAHWVIQCTSGLETQYGLSTEGFILDSWLIPIRGNLDELPEEVEELEYNE